MRPIDRGDSPQAIEYENYRDAFPMLVKRIGPFCSYCERRFPSALAVEHIQPKKAYVALKGHWYNFLLGCTNCNSTKKDKSVILDQLLLPDRDNTAAAYRYSDDGRITVNPKLTAAQKVMAEETLALIGLDKQEANDTNSNSQLVAIDRRTQRKEVWSIAQVSKADLNLNPTDGFRRQIARTAYGCGFFSIWMTVFEDDVMVRTLLIEAFTGTAQDCFDPNTTKVISPRPKNGLPSGGKT
ncbi:MAG: HNH endonuclease [Planctomycetota bacterium]